MSKFKDVVWGTLSVSLVMHFIMYGVSGLFLLVAWVWPSLGGFLLFERVVIAVSIFMSVWYCLDEEGMDILERGGK